MTAPLKPIKNIHKKAKIKNINLEDIEVLSPWEIDAINDNKENIFFWFRYISTRNHDVKYLA